jgi:hypothetical protein
MKIRIVGLIAACWWTYVAAADSGQFIGKVVVEWVDDDPFIQKMRLVDEFRFVDSHGKAWIVPRDAVLDGRSLPLRFRETIGLPFQGQYRKSSVVYDYYCQVKSEPWRPVHRMFYDAAVGEGVEQTDAKIMYMTLYGAGLRWEMAGSSCYRGCHAAVVSLTWKPAVEDLDFTPIIEWIRQAQPDLPQIDERLDAMIKKPGPHIFVQ